MFHKLLNMSEPLCFDRQIITSKIYNFRRAFAKSDELALNKPVINQFVYIDNVYVKMLKLSMALNVLGASGETKSTSSFHNLHVK